MLSDVHIGSVASVIGSGALILVGWDVNVSCL